MIQTEINFDAVTFDSQLSQAAKDEGISTAAWSRRELLWQVKEAVKQIALSRPSRTACADDGQEWLVSKGYQPSDLGNAAGSMFAGREWEFTGQWVKSKRVSSHKNDLRLWRLK